VESAKICTSKDSREELLRCFLQTEKPFRSPTNAVRGLEVFRRSPDNAIEGGLRDKKLASTDL